MKKSRGRKVNAKGRNEDGGQYAPLPYPMLQSAAWRSLQGSSIKVWLEIRSRYNGGNNGKLTLSLDEGARILGIGKATVNRATKELEDKGFLVRTKRGAWYGRQASEWRVTDRSCEGHPATNDWKRWTKPKKQSLGFITDHKRCATGPPQNRGP
jgi:hypothetical protein